MTRLELVPDAGWRLTLDEDDVEVQYCLICDKKVERTGFFCRNMQRMIHRECEEKTLDHKFRGNDTEHTHFNIIHTIYPKEGFKGGDEK
jgi:hypothetical protein